jgi:hypothetical protein
MAGTDPRSDRIAMGDEHGLGPLVEEFRPRPWAKWLTIALFAPLAAAGTGSAVATVVAILALPDVPVRGALLAAAIGSLLGAVGVWVVLRSWRWLGHRVEVRRDGIVRRWRDRAEGRRWAEVREVGEWSVRIKGREMPHLSVRFADGPEWEFDDEYQGYGRLRELIVARGDG